MIYQKMEEMKVEMRLNFFKWNTITISYLCCDFQRSYNHQKGMSY